MAQPALKSEFTPAARNQLFGRLKPICVEISKLALQPLQQTAADKAATTKRLLELCPQLYDVLDGQATHDSGVLDEKIAEYAFFPLSHLLRKQEQFPVRLTESVVKSLRVLISHGWKTRISKELSQQLLILLTFIIGGVPGREAQNSRQRGVPEETVVEAYRALTALVRAAGVSAKESHLTDAAIIPSLGHAISVILEGVTDGVTPEIQLEALQAILAVYTTIKQDEVLATFFPGTVSSLSRALSPPASVKAPKRVLISALQVLKVVLTNILGDMKTRSLQKQVENEKEDSDEADKGKVLTPAWLKATVSQVKLALSTVLKLRTHDTEDVQRTLEKLCIALLDECHSSLSNCRSMLVETAMILTSDEPPTAFPEPGLGDTTASLYGTSLQDLATIYPELMDTIKTTVYNWITSMPRVMQSSDERKKQQAIHNLLKGNQLVTALQIDSSTLEDSLSSALKDSIVALVLNSKNPKVLNEVDLDENLWRSSDLVQTGQELQTYRPVLLPQESQRATRNDLATLIQSIGTSSQQTKLAAEMLSYVRDSEGVDQISSFWLSFELLKSAFSKTADVDAFFDFTDAVTIPEDTESVFQELYSFSVSILSSHSDASSEVDWRLEAIALEVTAFAASRLKTSFRPELIDVLYPIATFLGSPHPELRGHAITTLNGIAASSGYGNVSELIIENVDYMVNSVSLRLNTFDISPASTKVLAMMIRLTGPRLIPFLDDVVAAIFAALDNYHGYPAFVESLFSVLSEVVEQGVRSDMLLIENGGALSKAVNHKKRSPESSGMDDILDILDTRAKKRKQEEEEEDVEEIIRGHPDRPWKSAKEELDALERRDKGEDDEEPNTEGNNEVTLPKTPTYTLLTKVTNLTQHYLTSPTPTLRKQLLDLLARVSPALAPDENAFLPLVNAVWPVVISRLHDSEPYVVMAACGTLSALCESAGDFLSTRFKTEWWDGLGRWCAKVRDEARTGKGGGSSVGTKKPKAGSGGVSLTGMGGRGIVMNSANHRQDSGILIPMRGAGGGSGSSETSAQLVETSRTTLTPGLGRFAQAAQTWEAVISLLIAIVSYVRVEDDLFDQILDLLADDVLARNEDARGALEVINADAVWLAMYERGLVDGTPAPEMNGVHFVQLEKGRGTVG